MKLVYYSAFIILHSALVFAAPTATQTQLRVEVFPAQVNLNTQLDRQSLVVQATQPDGITRDLTGEAKISLENPALAAVDGKFLRPLAEGSTQILIEAAGQTLKVPLTVKDAKADRPISFRLDVMPTLTKGGCNTGSCHGSGRGKDGFRLSLFGFDPAGDYHRLTREFSGRRINLSLPHESLLLTKATGKTNHTGGELYKDDSPLYATNIRWLQAGAPNDPPAVASVTGVEIYPRLAVLEGEGASQQLTVRATYSDGTDRDVTDLAVYITSNEPSAAVDPRGKITAAQRGEAQILARFESFTVGMPAIILPKGLQYAAPKYPASNYIDELAVSKLVKLRITPAELCDDATFLRRATIDITGQLPTPAEYQQFMADSSADKRAKLVDRLLSRKEFVELWVMKFAELLQIRSNGNIDLGISYKGTVLYYNWLAEQFGANVPMNKIVQKLIGASGSTFTSPATNFYQIERDNLKLAENVAQVFMGMRIQCAQCHNHPFDRWTMDDYYGFVAFFTQVGRKTTDDPRDRVIFNSGGGEARNPVGNRVVAPKFLGGDVPDVKGRDRREVLAEWLASPKNPFFAKNLANIVWAHFLGRGISDPVDDVRVSNPASNPQLIEALGAKFTEYDYDFKKLVRDICTSRTYQLSTAVNPSNELDRSNFSHSYVRRVRAEVLYDLISQVTETAEQNKFNGLPRGARAVQIADGTTNTYFLTTFGRATRETVCSCEVKMEPNLSQALHLLNGDTVQNKIRAGNVVGKLLEQKQTPAQIVENLYIRCLSRPPTAEEASGFAALLKDAKDPREALEDVFWALLNTKEFLFNH